MHPAYSYHSPKIRGLAEVGFQIVGLLVYVEVVHAEAARLLEGRGSMQAERYRVHVSCHQCTGFPFSDPCPRLPRGSNVFPF